MSENEIVKGLNEVVKHLNDIASCINDGGALNRIADALEKLVEKPLPVVGSTENTEVHEEVLMDLTEVTVIAITEKAMLVTKKGYQKWLPISTIYDAAVGVSEGDFLKDIKLTTSGEKWIPDKSWEPFKVVKK